MFEVKENVCDCNYYISDGKSNYIHRDGEIIYGCCEYWPTKELAQAVLDKYQPKHIWEHGDVFENTAGIQIYLEPCGEPIVVNLEHTGSSGTPEVQLPGPDTKFLFNIREKL